VNTAIRWRIITLQSILVVVLAAASGFAFYEGSFVTSMIHDQLVAQQITFPTAQALAADTRSSEYGSEFKSFAGQTVDNGEKAKVYAENYIGVHLKGVANGLTYATIGTKTSALSTQLANTPKTDPGYADLQSQIATLNAQRDTLFKGETLRAMLLNAYGWYTFGTYATIGGIGLMIGALAALGALVFELFVSGRKPETVKVTQKLAA
jgi:hypothetical protein